MKISRRDINIHLLTGNQGKVVDPGILSSLSQGTRYTHPVPHQNPFITWAERCRVDGRKSRNLIKEESSGAAGLNQACTVLFSVGRWLQFLLSLALFFGFIRFGTVSC